MFNGIISTSLRFFDTNPSGRILNLFSKDLGTVDEYLPKSLLDATQCILVMTGSVLLTFSVRPYIIIPIFLIGIVFVYVRKIYIHTSKAIKRMEGISMLFSLTLVVCTQNNWKIFISFSSIAYFYSFGRHNTWATDYSRNGCTTRHYGGIR